MKSSLCDCCRKLYENHPHELFCPDRKSLEPWQERYVKLYKAYKENIQWHYDSVLRHADARTQLQGRLAVITTENNKLRKRLEKGNK
jgi:hypothetical protein